MILPPKNVLLTLPETQQIMFFATADIQEWSNMDELKKVVAQANEKVPSLKFQAIETYPLPQFRTQYLVPYQNGVPSATKSSTV